MTDPNTKPPSTTPAAPSPKKATPVLGRIIVIVIVLLVSLAALGIAVPWVYYRCQYVVVGEATIKGVVDKIGARIEGRVKSIEVEVGQRVSKGQVLLRLEDSHLRAARDQARAEFQSATNTLENEKMAIEQTRSRLTLDIGRARGVTNKAAADVKAQQSVLTEAEEQYKAIAMLLKEGAAAKIEMDRMTRNRDQALAVLEAKAGSLESAMANYEKATNDLDGLQVREQHLRVLENQVEVARAKLAQAESDLEATIVRCDDDTARVLERIVEVGGSAKVGEPLISLWIGRPWVEAWTDERDLRKFKIGSPVEISLDASPNRKLAGHVEAIGLASDKQLQPAPVPATLHSFIRQNALVPVRIALEEENPRVHLGLSAMVGIKKESDFLALQGPHVAKDDTTKPRLLK